MIRVFDAQLAGHGHEQFNRAMALALRSGFGEDLVLSLNETQAAEWAKRPVAGIRVEGLAVKQSPGLGKLFGAIAECFAIRRILRKTEGEGSRFVFALSIGPVALWLFRRLPSARGSSLPFVVTLHGELQELASPKRGIASRAAWVRAALAGRSRNFQAIVLGRSIVAELEKEGIDVADFVAVPHPYSCPPVDLGRKAGRPLEIVAPGGTSLLKGSQEIFRLAGLVRDSLGDGAAHFALHGSWDPALSAFDNGLVEHSAFGRQLSPDLYDEGLRRADFFLFLYPPGSYRLMASGALLDAVRIGRPVLALRTPYFEEVFGMSGEIGRLFDSIEGIADFVAEFSQSLDGESYAFWLANLGSLRGKIDEVAVGSELARVVGNRGRRGEFASVH
ncbi:MAG TPA: hypothetical protein VMV44_00605 [Rectinemataceae bacterium]|nr:hypothetical protein [Rectinemataceae bacterium]